MTSGISSSAFSIIVAMVVIYILVTSGLSIYYKNHVKSGEHFMNAARSVPVFVVGVLMMSEFVGTPSTVGTAQQAFTSGIASMWNLVSSIVAFLIFGFFLAPKIYQTGEYTISGAIGKKYGNGARLAVSAIMIYALFVVSISSYTGGASAIATVVKLPMWMAFLLTGVVSSIYIATGGLKGVAWVSVIHFTAKYVGVIIAMLVGLKMAGGWGTLQTKLPEWYFTWDGHVGWSTILAWTIGNLGAVFSTQQIIQGMSGSKNANDAKKASLWAGFWCVPIGIFSAVAGVAAKYVYPKQNSLFALTGFVKDMNPWLAGIVTTAVVAMVFAGVATLSLAIASLLMKDFIVPYARPSKEKELVISRIISIVVVFLPIPFALYAPLVLKTLFFAKALRTAISVVVVMAFFWPWFSSGKGAVAGLIGAMVGASAWFYYNNPFGIDNIYIALVIPLVVMGVDHLLNRSKAKAAVADQPVA